MLLSPYLLLLAASLITGPSGPSSIDISANHGTVYQTHKEGDPTQGFLQIHNTGADDMLTGVNCPIADTSSLVGPDNQPITNLGIPAKQDVVLAPNGPHILLQSTHFSVQFGSIVPCSLTFRDAGVVSVYLYAQPAP